jgi:hypothetical protein
LRPLDPTLFAIIRAYEIPLCALLNDIDSFTAIHDMKYGIAAARASTHLKVRIRNSNRAIFISCLSRRQQTYLQCDSNKAS